VRATLDPPGHRGSGRLRVTSVGADGDTGSSSGRLNWSPGHDLRQEISQRLADGIIGLVGG
jgi:hypothetical protein